MNRTYVNGSTSTLSGLGPAAIDGFAFGLADEHRDELTHALAGVVSFIETNDSRELTQLLGALTEDALIAIGDLAESFQPELAAHITNLLSQGVLDLVVCSQALRSALPDELAESPRLHVLTGSRDARRHHLSSLAAQIQSRWCERTLDRIVTSFDATFVTGSQYADRRTEFLEIICKLLRAQAVGVYALRPAARVYSATAVAGAHLPTLIPVLSSASDECPIALDTVIDMPQVVLHPFSLRTIPGFILFAYRLPFADHVLNLVCSTAAREILHLFRGSALRAEFDSLRRLTALQNVTQDNDVAVEELLTLLQTHFAADGVSWIEILDRVGDTVKVAKTYIHFKRHAKQIPFKLDAGFSHYAITHDSACVATRFTWDSNHEPWGEGVEFAIDSLTFDDAKPILLRTIEAPGNLENEKSLAVLPVRRGNDIIGVLKLGSFTNEAAFDLQDLQQLKVLSEPIAALIGNIRNVHQLRIQIEGAHRPEELSQYAETLFFYREVALRNFHQVTNYVNDIDLEITLADAIVEDMDNVTEELPKLLRGAKQKAEVARELIANAQMRGRSLKPLEKTCQLISKIVRPALSYATEKASRRKDSLIHVEHTLTPYDYLVKVDPDLLYESLLNIINNGLSAIAAYKRATRRILFLAVREIDAGTNVRIEVSDTGIGIARADFAKLFQPFFTTKGDKGTGLGLYSARRLVEYFGGSVKIPRSAPLQGTTVEVVLPLVRRL